MSQTSEKEKTTVNTVDISPGDENHDVNFFRHEDDVRLAELGYKSEFKREFSVRVAFRRSYLQCQSLTLQLKVDRACCLFFFNHGRGCLCYVDLFFPTDIWGTCWHGLWLVDSKSFRSDNCGIYGGVGFINAVSADGIFS
jgi:hypothetical protein